MKRFLKVICAALAVSVVTGGGCVGGAVAVGMLVPDRGVKDSVALLQAQFAEMQETLDAMGPGTIYDQFAANPINEFEGMEEEVNK